MGYCKAQKSYAEVVRGQKHPKQVHQLKENTMSHRKDNVKTGKLDTHENESTRGAKLKAPRSVNKAKRAHTSEHGIPEASRSLENWNIQKHPSARGMEGEESGNLRINAPAVSLTRKQYCLMRVPRYPKPSVPLLNPDDSNVLEIPPDSPILDDRWAKKRSDMFPHDLIESILVACGFPEMLVFGNGGNP
ncbi:unnamed protein product [Caenorhabditis nigoni]